MSAHSTRDASDMVLCGLVCEYGAFLICRLSAELPFAYTHGAPLLMCGVLIPSFFAVCGACCFDDARKSFGKRNKK